MAMKRAPLASDEAGQGTLEYILLLTIVAIGFAFIMSRISSMDLAAKLAGPINGAFASTYRYGHPKAKGWDDGGPAFHPRATEKGNSNFRIFINPGKY
jgi:hypothetical protein